MNEDRTFISTFTGTGTVPYFIECGFKPRKVELVATVTRIMDEWFEGMTAAYAVHTTAAGTRTLVTSASITVSDGDDGMEAVDGAGAATVAITDGSYIVTGTSTFFPAELVEGDTVRINDYTYKVAEITSDTALTLESAALETDASSTLYRVNGRKAGVSFGTATNLDAVAYTVICER